MEASATLTAVRSECDLCGGWAPFVGQEVVFACCLRMPGAPSSIPVFARFSAPVQVSSAVRGVLLRIDRSPGDCPPRRRA